MQIASVILDIPTQALEGAFTYLVPDDLEGAEVGCAVLVPFGHRMAIGYIVSLGQQGLRGLAEEKPGPERLKAISQVLSRPYFDNYGARCARFLSDRYIAPLNACMRLFTPPGGVPRLVQSGARWRVEEPDIGPVDDRWVRLGPSAAGFTPRKQAVKQQAILNALASGELRVAELSMELGPVTSVLNALAAKGVVEIEHRRRMRGVMAGGVEEAFSPSAKPRLTEGQERALWAINAAQDSGACNVVLVDGVTGSGKTEVYLQAIEKTLALGRNAIVLVPEISLTPQTVARFRGRFGDMVAVMHSRMSQGERFDQWDLIRDGAARVVVGARSALFSPLGDVGLIVIDEEHEGSYKQDSAPRYHARDVGYWMAHERDAVLVLGSATPSIEALERCGRLPNWQRVELPARVNGGPLPAIEVVDMAREFSGGHRSMFSRKLSDALFETLEAGRKAVLLLNQRGFASFLLCRDCGFVPECASCSTSLTFHDQGNTLVCHHCGHREPAPAACPECASPYLKKFGAGTQRVEAELVSLLEGREAKVVRMDADTTGKKGAHQRLLEEFVVPGPAVLLGTQMIAKGLDFDEVVLVGVINADTMLMLPDFRSGERTFDLIEQVAGRAGRAQHPGRVLVQTYSAEAVAIRSAAAYDRKAFLDEELPKRMMLKYPPYARLANVLAWGKDEAEVRQAAEALGKDLQQLVAGREQEGWSCLPAVPCVLSRLRGSYRYHIVLRSPADADISALLVPYFRQRKPHKAVSVAVDVDPYDLL